MEHAVWTVLIAGLLPIVCAGIDKWGAKTYDNRQHRAWMASQEGRRARADAAQQNSFEAFPLFAAGVLVALHYGVDTQSIAQCGWFFIAMRLAYIYCYVTDKATWRSVFWLMGLLAVIRLFALSV